MKTLSFSNIPSIDFNFDDRDNRTQQQKNYEYSLQALSNLMASDDFDGVREQLVKEEAQAYENEYMQAAANNLTKGKTTVQDTVKVIDNFVEADNSPAVSLEKKTSETLLSELAADYPEVYAKYINKPEQFTKDSDYITNVILADEMYRKYSESYANTKHLVSVGAEVISSIGVSLINLGAPYEGAKQAYKLNKLKDIIDFNEDIITPTALGHNLRTVFNKNAKEMSPTEFKQFVDKFEDAIKDIPSVYQQEILEWAFEGYQPVDNLFMVSDIEDLGKIGKAIQNFNKAGVQKRVGNMTKALDDIIVREEEALSATAKADVTEATVAKNNKRVKKDVVKKVVKEEVEKAFENVDTTPETSEVAFATQLTEAKHIDEVSDATDKSVIDHKNWADQNATLIGRFDGAPFATYEEAERFAREHMIKEAQKDGFRVVTAWSRDDYTTPSRKALNKGLNSQIEGSGVYNTLQEENNIFNSNRIYERDFRELLPADTSKKSFKGFKQTLANTFNIDKDDVEISEDLFDNTLMDISDKYIFLRNSGRSQREAVKIIKDEYDKIYSESLSKMGAIEKTGGMGGEGYTLETAFYSSIDSDVGLYFPENDLVNKLIVDYLFKRVPLNHEPVNKTFLHKATPGKTYLNEKILKDADQAVAIENDRTAMNNLFNVLKKYGVELYAGPHARFLKAEEYKTPELTADVVNFKSIDDLVRTGFIERNLDEKGLRWRLWQFEEGLVERLKFLNPKAKIADLRQQAADIIYNEANIAGTWYSDVDLMSYDVDSYIPFFTKVPTVKGGKVSYSRRLDNPELLKYYTEPVKVNGQWFVKIYNDDKDFIKIEGN